MSNPNNYTQIYLEQGLTSLQEAGWDQGKINLVRQIFGEKMQWAYENGLIQGREQGVDMAVNALDELRETM